MRLLHALNTETFYVCIKYYQNLQELEKYQFAEDRKKFVNLTEICFKNEKTKDTFMPSAVNADSASS